MTKILFALSLAAFASGACLAEEEFQENKSTHFIVYYRGVDEDFVKAVVAHAERYYSELTERLGFRLYDYWTWDKRAKIYVYPDQETYMKQTGQPAWTGGVASYGEKKIWTYPHEAGFFDSLLPHEIGHIIFDEVVGTRRAVPLWLQEGVASYLEQAKRFGADRIVLEAMEKGAFIPLEELGRIDGNSLRLRPDVALFYAESVSIVNYLIQKFGTDKFNRLCQKLKDGKALDDALAYAYFDVRSVSGLAEQWERYLRDKQKTRMML